MFSLTCGRQTQYKSKQYHEKQVMLREGYIQETESKRRKLRIGIWLMCTLYKNKYKIFKPVDTPVRRGLRYKGEK
jgi:hypothetical protein